MTDTEQNSKDGDSATSKPHRVPGAEESSAANADDEFTRQSASWDTVCSRNSGLFLDGSSRSNGVIESGTQVVESIALPFVGLGSFGGSHERFSASNGSLGSFSGANDAIPVRWDSANSTDFHKSTSNTIWSTQVDGSHVAGSPGKSSYAWHYPQPQHSNGNGLCTDGDSSFRSVSGSGDRSSSDNNQNYDMSPLSMPQGLPSVNFLQHSAPGTPAVVPPPRTRGTTASPGPTPPISYGSLGSGLSSPSVTAPLRMLPLGVTGSFARCMREQPYPDTLEEVKHLNCTNGARDTAVGPPQLVRNSTGRAGFPDGLPFGGFFGSNQGNANLHTAYRYGGSSNGISLGSSQLPTLHVQHQWHSQSQLQLPPHSPGSLASLLPASPIRSNPLSQGLPPMPCSSRNGHLSAQSQLASEATQRYLLYQQKHQQQQSIGGDVNGPRRTVSFDGSASYDSNLTTTRMGSFPGHDDAVDHVGLRVLGRTPVSANSRFGRSRSELERSSTISVASLPLPYQPAGLRRHVSTGGLGDGGAFKQPPSVPMYHSYSSMQQSQLSAQIDGPSSSAVSGYGVHAFGSRGTARGPASRTCGQNTLIAQRGASSVGYGFMAGSESEQVIWGGNGEPEVFAQAYQGDQSSAHHRRVQSADFGGYIQPRGAPSLNSIPFSGSFNSFDYQQQQPQQGWGSSSHSRGGQVSGGRVYPNSFGGSGFAREGGAAGHLNGDRGPSDTNGYGGMLHGRSPSGGSSPQVLSRSTSGAGLASRICGSPMVRDKATSTSISNRQLWAKVTSMPSGGDGGPALGKETTVEDLLRVVRHLSPDASVVSAVERGLEYLDSRALAALLKELAKAGLPGRASELFEWLRSLPSDHVLAGLCDVYTYTTIIAQCGTGAGLQSALILTAEMKERGIVMNCHAYSALMNVCIKAGDLSLALEVFDDMKAKNCTPNLVTYNILIDIYGKTGKWQKAKDVLDRLKHQNIAAEVRTYNTIIGACARAGQPEAAESVYERMLQDHAVPTATTATSLVSAFAKSDQIDKALKILNDMAGHGAERSPVAYGALVAAAERCGRPHQALTLFNDMILSNLKPSAATFAAALSACAACGQWKTAIDIFEMMRNRGCKPDAHAHGSLMVALASSGQWQGCLSAFARMQSMGLRTEATHVGAVVAGLWSAGTVMCQAAALSAYHAAFVSGSLSVPRAEGAGEEKDAAAAAGSTTRVAAAHTGAVCAATLHWLLLRGTFEATSEAGTDRVDGSSSSAGDAAASYGSRIATGNCVLSERSAEEASQRDKAPTHASPGGCVSTVELQPGAVAKPSSEGSVDYLRSSASRSTSSAATNVPPGAPGRRAVLLLIRDRPWSTAAAPTQQVLELLEALLAAICAPVSASLYTSGIRLEADVAAVRQWAAQPACEAAWALTAAAARVASPVDAAIADSQASQDAECRQALVMIRDFEEQDCISPTPFTHPGAAAERRSLLATMREVVQQLQLPGEVTADALLLTDRSACAVMTGIGGDNPYAGLRSNLVAGSSDLAVAAVSLAAHNVGLQVDLLQAGAAAGLGKDVTASVQSSYQRLQMALSGCAAGKVAMSAPRVLGILLKRLGAPPGQSRALTSWVGGTASEVLASALGDHRLLAFTPSTVAVAALVVGGPAAAAADPKPSIEMLTCQPAEQAADVTACSAVLREACPHSHGSQCGDNNAASAEQPAPSSPCASDSQSASVFGSSRSLPTPPCAAATDGSSDGPDLDNLREQLAASGMQ